MALLFSPVSQDVVEGTSQPRPRHAFLMLHAGERRSRLDIELEGAVCAALDEHRFEPIRATDVGGTGDYLDKIIGIIRGCGFGIAIFSEATPPPTLANIFYEVGICQMLGKPVILAKTDTARTPSDFVRTEWISQGEDESRFAESMGQSLIRLSELPGYFKAIAEVAMEAEDVDYELAFERFRQAVLIGGDVEAAAQIRAIYDALRAGPQVDAMRVARQRLRTTVGRFLKMLPSEVGGPA